MRSGIFCPVELHLPCRADGQVTVGQSLNQVQAHIDTGRYAGRGHHLSFVDPAQHARFSEFRGYHTAGDDQYVERRVPGPAVVRLNQQSGTGPYRDAASADRANGERLW